MNKRWIRRAWDDQAVEKLSGGLGQPPWLCRLLSGRGIGDLESAARFLDPGMSQCHDPNLLQGMDGAVERVLKAIREGEPIVIYGDYDVDGVTSTALLMTVLRRMGAKVNYFIPDRLKDGYGLNTLVLEKLKKDGAALVITVDCGVTAVAEAAAAKRLALDLIITDHHVPLEARPDCVAVLNPKTSPQYPYDMLGGVGVAWKFAQALLTAAVHPDAEELLDQTLELVAVGTVCDVAPLDGENRVLVREGIRRLRKGRWPGFVALARHARVPVESIHSGTIGFALGPRLNAGGRIGDPSLGVELLLSKDWNTCDRLAQALEQENTRRRSVEKTVVEEAKVQAAEAVHRGDSMLVLEGENWHPGVIGLAASRVVEAFSRPTLVLAKDAAKGTAKGSGRARKPLNLVAVLDACKDLLVQYGGHEAAAGLTIENGNIEAFRARCNEVVSRQINASDLEPRLSVDMEVELKDMNAELMKTINRLSPFGMKNPKPVFAARRCQLVGGTRTVGGGGEHLKIQASQGRWTMPGIAFKAGPDLSRLDLNQPVDLAFQLEWNEFQGRRELQLDVKDIRQPSGTPLEEPA